MYVSITQIGMPKDLWCIVEFNIEIIGTPFYIIHKIHKPFNTMQEALSKAEQLSHNEKCEILQIVAITPELKTMIEEY